MFVVEGVRAVDELLRSSLRVLGALASPQLASNPRAPELRARFAERKIEIAEVTQAEFDTAADTDSPQGILAFAAIPSRSLDSLNAGLTARVLVLDAVQDPGNVGTLVRTAAALGATATVALPGTVDLWNAKVVRSAMGAHFHHPAFHCTWDELRRFLDATGLPLWGADVRGAPVETVAKPARLALAVGNEGSGLTDPVRSRVDAEVSLPLDGGIESLNVAVAAGILLYELRP